MKTILSKVEVHTEQYFTHGTRHQFHTNAALLALCTDIGVVHVAEDDLEEGKSIYPDLLYK